MKALTIREDFPGAGDMTTPYTKAEQMRHGPGAMAVPPFKMKGSWSNAVLKLFRLFTVSRPVFKGNRGLWTIESVLEPACADLKKYGCGAALHEHMKTVCYPRSG
jgi:hypothetical protein